MSWTVHLYWLLGWLLGGFGVVEGLALAHHRTVNTFSNSCWVWLGTYTHPSNRWLRLTIFIPVWIALGVHLANGLSGKWLIATAAPLVVLILWSTFVKRER